MHRKGSAIDMVNGPLVKSIILYSIPVMLTGLLQLLFNAADLVVVGQFCGSVSVAAVGATGSIINLIVNLFIGLSVGAGVVVAQGLGAHHDEDVSRTVHAAVPASILSGLLLTVVGLVLARPLLRLMATPDDVIDLSVVYMKIYFCGITFSMLYNFGAAILRAVGDSRGPLIYLSIAGVLNIILNVFFVVSLNLDVAGVALATSISQGVSALLTLRALLKRTDACRLELKKMRLHSRPLIKMARIGLPAGIQGALFSISNVVIQSSINSFGSATVSGNAAASNVDGFVLTAMEAFYQTGMNFTGQNAGAGRFDRVRRIAFICLACVTVSGLVLGNLTYLFGRPLLEIYITDSPEAISAGMTRLLYVCAPYFLCGLMDVTTGLIRGLGTSVAPMIVSILGICGMRLAWIFTIFRVPEYHTMPCLLISYPISWIITLAAQLVIFFHLIAKYRRTLEAHADPAGNRPQPV